MSRKLLAFWWSRKVEDPMTGSVSWLLASGHTPTKKELPDHYKPWMEIANRLPYLIESRQLRAHVYTMPLLDRGFLKSHREQRLAHLVLGAITMGFVWQEGETQAQEVLPRTLAIPFVEVSRHLGLPPILVHSDLVLTNWTKRNPEGNLETIISFPGGERPAGLHTRDCLGGEGRSSWASGPGSGVEAILQHNQDELLQALQKLRVSIQDITSALAQMHDYVDPDIFYSVIRIFLSGWRDNPAIPTGLVYEGVTEEPLEYSGGSAAQSSVLHAFDEFLGIQHCKESDFLHRMRNYMPPAHKTFLEDLRSVPSLRDCILASGAGCCLIAYNQCVEALAELRSYHITMVARYLISAAAKFRNRMLTHLPRLPQALEDRGTGGTAVLSFLKSVRRRP